MISVSECGWQLDRSPMSNELASIAWELFESGRGSDEYMNLWNDVFRVRERSHVELEVGSEVNEIIIEIV